jgi:outer membrane receptor protein involved in Fe transport
MTVATSWQRNSQPSFFIVGHKAACSSTKETFTFWKALVLMRVSCDRRAKAQVNETARQSNNGERKMKRNPDFKFGFALVVALLLFMMSPVLTSAQMTRGVISGTVQDENSAAVPGAQVSITSKGTNLTKREATTDDQGFYRVGALDPGVYIVIVEKQGFQKNENREITVKSAGEVTFDTVLKTGSVAATVDVTAQTEAITLDKTNPSIGLTATSRQAVELPIGRNVNNLALLAPNTFTAPGSSGISVNGQRARNNNFTIDGSDNNDISVTIQTTPVVPEAVQEYRLQTNPYSVEFGRNSGAQIDVITKSGTNGFHGDVFEYYRGSRLNALDNIEKASGLTRPSRFNRNQFGFDIGGPLHLPRFGEGGRSIINGRDRTFFFYLFQGDRTRTGANLQGTIRIPTPTGFAALGSVPLRAGQSAASRAAVLNSISFLNQAYALNPTFRSITNTTVNGVAIQTGLTNLPAIQPTDIYNHTLRIDHKLTDNDNLTGRYISNKPSNIYQISNTQFGSLFAGDQVILDQNLAISETHVFGQQALNEFRFSFIRRNLQFPEYDPRTPSTGINGFFSIGGASNFPQGRVQDSAQFSDTLSLQRGRNTFKFGADIRRIKLFNLAAFDSKGTFTFNNFQDFLNNNAVTFAQALQTATFDARQTQQFYFVGDDVRVSPSLTLNLGLRYEYSSVPFGFFGATDAASLGALVPGPVKPDKNNWAPSFGFAYAPHEKNGLLNTLFGDGTGVLRGGYRISYDVLFYNILTVNASNFPRVVVGRIDNALDLYPNIAPVSGAPVFSPLATYVNTPSDAKTPNSRLYSLSFQREISRNLVLEVGYTGSRSFNQVNQLQANPAILTAAQAATVATTQSTTSIPSVQARRINPLIGSRTLIATTAKATYNAGFASLNKRFSRGLQFGISYTYGKLMSDNDESLGVGSITTGSPQIPQDFANIRAEHSLSAFDRTNRLVANYIYEVPMPGFAKGNGALSRIFGGWEISGITTRQSGQPFSIVTGVDSNGNGAGGDRPNFNPAGQLIFDPTTHDLRTFTTSGVPFFVPRGTNGLPLAFSLGNGSIGRNTYRGAGVRNTDLSLSKKIRIDETRTFILRADFLNAFNQDTYGNPVNSLNSTDFGKNLNNFGNRSITLGAKFRF